jgi:hypothetical protein
MTKEQFKNSGLLEQHVLGLTSPEEEELVASFLARYPDLLEEVNELHQAMEQYVQQQDIPAPPRARARHEAQLAELQQSRLTRSRTATMVAVAASIILGLFASWLLWSNQQIQREVNKTEAEFAALKEYCEQAQREVQSKLLLFANLQDPATRSIILKGTAMAPDNFAIAYWNPTRQQGWIAPNNLPPLPPDTQYQIWADIEGVMVSVGLIPPGSSELVTIQYLPQAESLNITQEQLGGAEHPNVSLLTVNGLL